MKVYCFYLYDKEISEKKYPAISADRVYDRYDIQFTLYGFCKDKDYANIFKRTRKKGLFIMKIVHMNKTEYNDFKDNNSQFEIRPRAYYTTDVDDGVIKPKLIHILSTEIEYDKICWDAPYYISRIFDKAIEQLTYIPANIFNNTLFHCLKDELLYNDIISWLELIDNVPSTIKIDGATLYFQIFENTYSLERMCEACISTNIL